MSTEPAADPKDELTGMVPHLRHLPQQLDRILTQAGRGDFRIRHVVDEDHNRTVRTLANRGLLVLAGSVFMIASVLLLVAGDSDPNPNAGIALQPLFGYSGLILGAVLLLRAVAAVARDGTS